MIHWHHVRDWYEANGFHCEFDGTVLLAWCQSDGDIAVTHYIESEGQTLLVVVWAALDASRPDLALRLHKELNDQCED